MVWSPLEADSCLLVKAYPSSVEHRGSLTCLEVTRRSCPETNESVLTIPSDFIKSPIVLHLSLGVPVCSSSWFSNQIFVYMSHVPLCATYPVNLILLDLIIMIIFSDENQL